MLAEHCVKFQENIPTQKVQKCSYQAKNYKKKDTKWLQEHVKIQKMNKILNMSEKAIRRKNLFVIKVGSKRDIK